MTNISTCCEGQGTRLHGSLPEYVFSTGAGAAKVVLNLYVNASIETSVNGRPVTVELTSDLLGRAGGGSVSSRGWAT